MYHLTVDARLKGLLVFKLMSFKNILVFPTVNNFLKTLIKQHDSR